jgi:hypothetical protein
MRQAISELNAIDPGYEKYSADNDADANEKERDTLSRLRPFRTPIMPAKRRNMPSITADIGSNGKLIEPPDLPCSS